MRRRTTILIAIVVLLLIALGIIWETVPYVRYQLISVTGGTQAPQSFSLLQGPPIRRDQALLVTLPNTTAEDMS